MSTATLVPETYELEGDDAIQTLRHTGLADLARCSFQRFRVADGFSHARALAFQVTLTLVPGLIAVVGLTTALKARQIRDTLVQTVDHLAPGPAGQIVTQAFRQGQSAGGGSGRAALAVGIVATLISATFAMAQIERGANRIYGVEKDRPTTQRYARAFLLACSAGLLAVAAFVVIVAGTAIGRATGLRETFAGLWSLLRWPLGLVLAVGAFALLFKESPRRRQPSPAWLAVGSAVAIGLWFLFTGLLAWYLGVSADQFGQTYGPLAGLIGILLWTFLTSLALYLGLAFAAQLEATRAGVPGPSTEEYENLPPRDRVRHGRTSLR